MSAQILRFPVKVCRCRQCMTFYAKQKGGIAEWMRRFDRLTEKS